MIRAVAALVMSATLLTVAAPTAGAAATPDPAVSPAPADQPAPTADASLPQVTASLVGLTPGALEPSGRLSASVTATNRGNSTVDDVVLELALTERPLSDRDSLRKFLEEPGSFATRVAAQQPELPDGGGEETSGEENTATSGTSSARDLMGDDEPEPVGPSILSGASRTVTIGASPEELGLPEDRWGIYGAVLMLRSSAGDIVVDAVPITWAGAPVPTLNLSVLAQATGSDSRVEAVLGASNVPGVTSVFDPTGITNARAFGTGLLEREGLRLPGGNPDLTSLAHAGDSGLMDFALSLPAATNLAPISRAKWLAVPAAIDELSIQTASDLGATAVLAMPDAAGYTDLAGAADSAVMKWGDTALLVPDAGFSNILAQYRPGTEAAKARAVAESALIAQESQGQSVLVALGDRWHPSSPEPSATIQALMASPWVESVPIAELIATDAAAFSLPATLDKEADLPAEQVNALALALAHLRTLSEAATHPEAALADWGSDLLQAVAVPLREQPGMREAATSAAIAEATRTHSSLRIAESSDLNLLADTGEIPITVINALSHDVEVQVDLSSISPNLLVLETPTIMVPAGEERAALVPVEAVSSANVAMSVLLRSPNGDPVSEAQAFAVRVRADWGTAATAVFSVLLVLLLIAGLVRTARRGRKDTRSEPRPAPDTAPDPDTENVDIDEPGGLENPADPNEAASPEGAGEHDQDDEPAEPERKARD